MNKIQKTMLKLKFTNTILIALLFGLVSQTFAQKKPNIIFILADDYGVGEVGCYGADNYKTPNIDKLANTGIKFNHCYTASLCGPSRALLMTGRYAFRTGAVNQDKTGEFTPQAETMIPKTLKKVGYISASIGKWGQLPRMPSDFGFDTHLTFNGSGIYWNTQAKGKDYALDGKRIPLKDKEYMPNLMHNKAVDFIAENKNKPFFLYYSLSHVHNEILPTPESKTGITDDEIYADNVTYMDKLVGKLMKSLDSLHLRENTLIVFMGDNGTANARAGRATIQGKRLLGAKGSMQEGGGLVPMIVNWKGVTKPKVSNTMVDASDFFPTFMELAGIKTTENPLDGQSILPEIKGQKAEHRTWIFNQLANNFYVRELNWKLNQKGELFDMTKAPFEEILVTSDTQSSEVIAARTRLQKTLDQLNPSSGVKDDGDGTGRHAKNQKSEKKED
jgi:arylsulfatase A